MIPSLLKSAKLINSKIKQNLAEFSTHGRTLFLTWFERIDFDHEGHFNFTKFMILVPQLDAKESTAKRILS